MADDPNKKKAVPKRISKQPHEQSYQRHKAAGKTGSMNSSAAKNTSRTSK